MGDDTWTQLKDVFLTALEQPPDGREDYLEVECGDDTVLHGLVRAMLEAHEQGSNFGAPTAAPARDVEAWATPLSVGSTIGSYEIVRRIAAGSMGTVYEARQTTPERAVALKLMHPWLACPSSLERFRLEMQILARLQHPGIARVYDAGVLRAEDPAAPGVPYYVMELIDGLPLSAHVVDRRIDKRASLLLFATICDAVQHAHQRGVLHRDLKPSNILIDPQGQPKLIDFGIARVLEREAQPTILRTQVGQVLGTLAYMSPEQAAGEADAVDTRSDVYSLGVILFELVADCLPHDLAGRTLAEALRMVQEDEPPTLGRIDRELRGDLEIVTAKALSKDREHRYPSVSELGADVRRYLNEQPITARPAGLGYRIRKLVRRNRIASMALAAFAVAVVVGVVLAVTFGLEAVRQRRIAAQAAKESEQVSSFLREVFLAGATNVQLSPQALLDIVLRRLEAHGDDFERGAEATLRELAARACGFLSRSEEAVTHLECATAIRVSLPGGSDDPASLRASELLVEAYNGAGRLEDARRQIRAVLEVRRRMHGPDHFGVDPNGRLAVLVATLTPDEPEATWVRDQRLTGELSADRLGAGPRLLHLPVIVEDGFDGDALAQHWDLWHSHAIGWDYEVADSSLTVRAIRPIAYATENGQPSSTVGLNFGTPPLTDFSVSLECRWDSAKPGLEPECRAMQAIWLVLGGSSGRIVASCAYEDSWFGKDGQRRAKSGDEEFNSGQDTLPARGRASMRIDRVGEGITVFWNGEACLVSASEDPLVEVQIQLTFMPRDIKGHLSHLGTLTLDHFLVEGVRKGP